MEIGKKIKQLRLKMGLSQIELADKLNTTKQTIYKYENGIVTNIPSDKIERMAKIFNVSPADIMGWTNNINNTPIDNYTDEEKRLINNYRVLDDIDRAEIRGEIKQMLKADKYSAAPEFDIAKDICTEINGALKKGSINSK